MLGCVRERVSSLKKWHGRLLLLLLLVILRPHRVGKLGEICKTGKKGAREQLRFCRLKREDAVNC